MNPRARPSASTDDLVNDPGTDERESAQREGVVAFAGCPLIVDDRVIGVLAIHTRRPLGDLTRRALGSLADELALGIQGQLNGCAP